MTDLPTNKIFRVILTVLCFILVLTSRYLPLIAAFNRSASQVIYQFAAVLLLWLFVAIDWPSLLLLFSFSLLPEVSFNRILQAAFGNQIFAFLLFTFSLTYAVAQAGLLRRIAYAFINSKLASAGKWYFVCTYFASILFIGSVVSPTVLFFVYLAILEELFVILHIPPQHKLANMLMMGTVFMCGISSGMTTVSHVFPVIALGLAQDMLNLSISHLTYSMLAVPTGCLSALLVILIFRFVMRPDLTLISSDNLNKYKIELSRLNMKRQLAKKEKIILIVTVSVIAAWILPDLLIKFIAPDCRQNLLKVIIHYFRNSGLSLPPLAGVMLLSCIKIEDKPILSITEAFTKGVNWASLLMCASTLALGTILTLPELEFNTTLAAMLKNNLPLHSSILPVFIFCLWAGIQTNFSSNMITATLVTGTVLSLAPLMQNVNLSLLVIFIGMLSAYAFAAPSAMPCVAVAASSPYSSSKYLLKYGLLLIILIVLLISFGLYPLLASVV